MRDESIEEIAQRQLDTNRSGSSAFVRVPTNLAVDHPAPTYVVDQWVPRNVVTLLGAHGGAGKSVFALILAAHVACGRTWADFGIDRGRVVYVTLEDPGSILNYRLRRIVDQYELDHAAITEGLVILDGTKSGAALAGEVRDEGTTRLGHTAAMDELRDAAKGAGLIVVDNASDGFDANENDRRMVRGFVRRLAQLARENNAGLVLLAHIDKAAARNGSAGNSYSGSTAWHNSARSRLTLSATDGGIELVQEKAQFSGLADPVMLRWTDHGVLVPIQAAGAFVRGIDDTQAVMAALKAAWAAGVDVSASRTGPTTTQAVLATFDELPRNLRGNVGRGAFWSALGKLLAAGEVAKAEITTSQRKKKSVLVDAKCASSSDREIARAISPTPPSAYSAQGVAPVCAGSGPIQADELAQTGARDECQRVAVEYRLAKGGV